MADKVRFGIVGVGNMGGGHLRNWKAGKMPETELVAVCDLKQDRLDYALEEVPGIATFKDFNEMIHSGLMDAVIIATPHYFHPPMVMAALDAGLHVMSEKPAGVYTKQVREMNEHAAKSDKTFAIMFNQRTNCLYRKMREIVQSGKYGELRRVNWIITDWFRTQAYYDSGEWRATWAGEGGGVLLNQCPHQLDLWQWICGMPAKVRADCRQGKWHDIEVEDDVMIYVEYPNGATGCFSTTTGDFPGANRLEVTLQGAKLIAENGKLTVYEVNDLIDNIIAGDKAGFAHPEYKVFEEELDGLNEQHVGVMNAFAAHILRGEPLVAGGEEGINGLTISNAAFLSSWLGGKVIELPIDEDLYYEELKKRIATSRAKVNVVEQVQGDMSSTF